jgi:hypothetical protein
MHTRQSSTQNNKNQVSQKHSFFSWWWAHSGPKHVEKRNKHSNKNCAPNLLHLQGMSGQQNVKFWNLNICDTAPATVQFCKVINITVHKSLFLMADNPVAAQGLANHYINCFVKFIPLWCTILQLAHVLPSTPTNFNPVDTCRTLRPYWPSPSILSADFNNLKQKRKTDAKETLKREI